MSKSLVIVESPAKAKTIQKYLGKDYVVLASKGHIRDLPKSGLNIDVEHDYAPKYEVLEDHKDVLSELKKAAKDSDEIFLAPDPDREGEAIAWHIAQELAPMKKPMRRIEFHEITKKGVQDGLSKPRTVDEQRFFAQQARRILDRLIGYELSSVLWKRLCRQVNGHFLSAGRVQSVALRLIVEREEEIRAFVPQEYWPVDVALVGTKKPNFNAHVIEVDGVKVVTPSRDRAVKTGEKVVSSKADAEALTAALLKAKYVVRSVEKRERRRRAPPPYITSSLQRDASSRLGFSASRTMQVAQRLYEGVEVGAEGPVGLITYMRTDSTRISNDAITAVREHITSKYGAKYLPEKANFFKTRSSAQDAHEAIRPTNLDLHPDSIKRSLKPDEFKVYKLIYDRFVACQMIEALYDQTTVLVDAKADARAIGLRTSGQTLRFAGWLDAYGALPTGEEVAGEEAPKDGATADAEDGALLPDLREGEALSIVSPPGVQTEQKFSQPAPRYNEGTLVKALEELGIGRPSTYAEIVSKVQSRDYVEKQDRALVPTKLGLAKSTGLRARGSESSSTTSSPRKSRRTSIASKRASSSGSAWSTRSTSRFTRGATARRRAQSPPKAGRDRRRATASATSAAAPWSSAGGRRRTSTRARDIPSARTSSTRTPRRHPASTRENPAPSAAVTCSCAPLAAARATTFSAARRTRGATSRAPFRSVSSAPSAKRETSSRSAAPSESRSGAARTTRPRSATSACIRRPFAANARSATRPSS
jgi:DNA topoisomerase-1